ncbi:MAG: ABC transporter permease [Phycisphaeraceae bacterium]|nr:ABC transporter permease [Phycisphaerales bacterium]MCB9861493.1 ABC transporter permease [Phycisphaeraceae bacterium]
MTTYLIRRLLLIVPTLFGITFLVFMIIAMSPGGIGAAMKASGGQMNATSAAMKEARLEDRYGLDAPPVVQYVRWLAQISPIKFGPRAQIDEAGDTVLRPREQKPPILWEWFTDDLAVDDIAVEPFAWPDGATDEHKRKAWRQASQEYARVRVRAIGLRKTQQILLVEYAQSIELRGAYDVNEKIRESVLRSHKPATSHPMWAAIQQTGQEAIDAYRIAYKERLQLLAMLDAKPYKESGVPIVPGILWLGSPDLGKSFSRTRPVSELILQALPVTLTLNLIAFTIIYAVAIPSGMLAAAKRGSAVDSIMGAAYIALWSFPIPLAGVLAIGFLASRQGLGMFPVSGLHDVMADNMPYLPTLESRGYLFDTIWHMVLPVLCIVYGGFAVLSKQVRASMLDNYNADYVRTAKAKGVRGIDILLQHVFRNSLLPVITIFVSIFPATFSGSVVIEKIFNINGMGKLVLDSIYQRDRELLLATTLIVAAVNLLALLLADILYALADPRITYD